MEYLMIKYSGGAMAVLHRQNQDYSDGEAVASDIRDRKYPGETYKWCCAEVQPVEDFGTANSKTADDFDISQKQNVPGTDTKFYRENEDDTSLADTDLVVHCSP